MDKKPVIIFGATDLGVAVKEIFDSNEIVTYCYLDDDDAKQGLEIDEVSVLGKTDDQGMLKFIGKKCDAFVAYDENKLKKSLVKMLNEKRKVMPVNAVHKNANISPSAQIGYGNYINSGALIGTQAIVSNHSLIHSNAVIEHLVELGDFVQVGAGSNINARVIVEDEVFIGSGVTIVAGVTIGKGARIGAGSVVVSDIKAGATVFGNPAAEIE